MSTFSFYIKFYDSLVDLLDLIFLNTCFIEKFKIILILLYHLSMVSFELKCYVSPPISGFVRKSMVKILLRISM